MKLDGKRKSSRRRDRPSRLVCVLLKNKSSRARLRSRKRSVGRRLLNERPGKRKPNSRLTALNLKRRESENVSYNSNWRDLGTRAPLTMRVLSA
jgi:hypothetical protein